MRVSNITKYEEAFKQDALTLLRKSDRGLSTVAHDLGISPTTLRYWYNREMAKNQKGRPRGKPPILPSASRETATAKLARLERENSTLRKQVEELEMDRAILKKAAAFFAKESE